MEPENMGTLLVVLETDRPSGDAATIGGLNRTAVARRRELNLRRSDL